MLKLPFSYSRRHEILMMDSDPNELDQNTDHSTVNNLSSTLIHSNDVDLNCLQEISRLVGPLKRVKKSKEEFAHLLDDEYSKNEQDASKIIDEVGDGIDLTRLLEEMPVSEDLLDMHDDAPVIQMINSLLKQAIHDRASDIHLEAFEKNSIVRFRVDGDLRDIVEMRPDLHAALVSRIKIIATLDIAEKRMPQDGRISLKLGGRLVDVRVSTLPTAHGERVVLRLLEKNYDQLDLMTLGMSDDTFKKFDGLIHQPHGIVLVTGPTGSGKTTTLYGALLRLRNKINNIMTVEDPIEYSLSGISQTQVNPKIDMTFARALRSILRQDPDIVMLGEIRDLETAQIAVQASLTGHLVLATLHTNDAPSAVTRLIDMGVQPFLLSSSLLGVLSQRLLRMTCSKCLGEGCSDCGSSGYRGRIGIYELMTMNPKIKELIYQRAPESDIRKEALASGMSTLAQDGERWIDAHKTTRAELLRVTGSDEGDK